MHNKQQAFQRAFEPVRISLNEKQKRRNDIYIKKVQGPTYKEGQKALLYHPVIAVGTTSRFASPWKGPYVIETCLNDVKFRNMEETSSKQQIVHYDRLKLFFEPPPTSNVPTGNKTRNFQSTQDRADTHKHIDGTLNHDDCLSLLPAPSSIFTPIPVAGRTTASSKTTKITPLISSAPARREVTRSPPVFSRSSTLEQPCPQTGHDVAIQSPPITPIHIQPLIPENDFLYRGQSPRDNVTEIVDAAARNLRRTPPANTSNMQLRPNTLSQRKARLLFTTYLPEKLTDYNSPERKTQSQAQKLIKLLQQNEKLIIRNNEDLLSGSRRYYTSGERFSLQTPYSIQLRTSNSYRNSNVELPSSLNIKLLHQKARIKFDYSLLFQRSRISTLTACTPLFLKVIKSSPVCNIA